MSRRPRPLVVFQALRARPRLVLCVCLGVAVFLLAPLRWRPETRALVAWDVAVFLYLALVLRLASRSTPDSIRRNARTQDDGALTTLAFSTLAALACFTAIAFELAALKGLAGASRVFHGLLVAGTIPLAWSFIHSMFALHYAHEYYDAPAGEGHPLQFPGDRPASYWDFLYFSFILGTSGQTADVSIADDGLRRIALVHCVLAFFFNVAVLGLTVNVASSLL